MGDKALVVNVIDPVVQEITKSKDVKKIGVIGTKGTIKSDIYAKKIKAENKQIETASLATPLLAPMIEEGFFNNKISRTVIESYLSRPKLAKIDSLILACTHYPLIKNEVEEIYRGKVRIIDSAGVVAKHVKEVLLKHKLANKTAKPQHHFYVSDYTEAFEKSTRFFFKSALKLKEVSIWK